MQLSVKRIKPAYLKMLAVVLAVVVLPLAYSFFYLWAFWDPYSHLSDLPIAVVNEDQGATLNGITKNIGESILDELRKSDDVKWVFTTPEDAADGLANRRYYGEVVFPKDFSEQIATVDNPEKIQGLFLYKVNEKRNFLAGQVMNRVAIELKDKITKSITQEIVKAITDEMKNLPSSLEELNDGLAKLNDGSSTLYSKMGTLMNAQKRFGDGVQALDSGIGKAITGSATLSTGADSLNTGAEKLSTGLGQLEANLPKLTEGSKSLSEGLATFDESLKKFTAGTNQYIEGVQKSSQAQEAIGVSLQKYLAAHPEAMRDANMQALVKVMEAGKEGAAQLKTAGETLKGSTAPLTQASGQLSLGASSINTGIVNVKEGVTQLAAGANTLSEGTTKFSSGVKELSSGLVKAKAGSEKLVTSAEKLLDGERKLQEGIAKLDEGVVEAHDGVSEAVVKANDKVENIDQVDVFISEPVKMADEKINPIPDYGTAFTPYFVSLSLWVGALMMFFAIYLEPNIRFKRQQNQSKGIVRFLAYTGIGIAQAVVVAFVLLNGLHLQVKSIPLFYLTVIAISFAFVAIMRFLLVHLGNVGKFFGVLFLILQLTACGGTFPMELVPSFFQIINPFMPMTYSVNALKEVISGIDYGYFQQNLVVLLAIAATFTALNIGLARLRHKRNPYLGPVF